MATSIELAASAAGLIIGLGLGGYAGALIGAARANPLLQALRDENARLRAYSHDLRTRLQFHGLAAPAFPPAGRWTAQALDRVAAAAGIGETLTRRTRAALAPQVAK